MIEISTRRCAGSLAVLMVALCGCAAPPTEQDVASDSAGVDTVVHDAGGDDAGGDDSGAKDSGANDSGANDSGAKDSGAKDSGVEDSGGTQDAGDAMSTDASKADIQPSKCTHDGDCPPSSDPCQPNRCVSGTCKPQPISGGLCDDGNPCTQSDICKSGTCAAGANVCSCQQATDCAAFDDLNACNGTLICDKTAIPYACVVDPTSIVACTDVGDTQCKLNTCDPSTGKCGLKARPNGTLCNDGVPCTVESSCKAGACVGSTASFCQCASTADCATFEDKNLCNGVLYCDLNVFPYTCKVNPGSLVSCPDTADLCTHSKCAPETGKCVTEPAKDGTPCDDGNGATLEDSCKAGACQSGVNVAACKQNADCKDDGDLCNGVPYCDKGAGQCKPNPVTVITCPSVADGPCTKNTCQPASGTCKPENVLNGSACQDGDSCTTGEYCLQGLCAGGKQTCFCKNDAECADKDDGNTCNGTMFCNKATGGCELDPTTAVVCKTVGDTDCVKNACVPLSGACTPTRIERTRVEPCPGVGGNEIKDCRREVLGSDSSMGQPCDDGDPCTAGEICAAGACGGGTFTCSCSQDSECQKLEDGNACNGTLFCNKAKVPATCDLNPSTKITCQTVDDTACRKNTCQPQTGKCLLLAATDGGECDDDEPCTKGDHCSAGACLSGLNTCECLKTADCAKKEDADLCNGTLYCDSSGEKPTCKLNPATIVTCPTGADTTCSKAACNKTTGKCAPAPVKDGAPCDDGDLCSTGDLCLGGVCLAGQATGCDDGDVCTLDGCDAKGGCLHQPHAGICELDGDKCTLDRCKGGTCVAGKKPDCDDANECTLDACDAKTGKCGYQHRPDGTACDDGNLCTTEGCEKGQCVSSGKSPDGTACAQGLVCFDNVCGTKVPAGTVVVPAGPFWMGCNPAHEATVKCRAEETPYHKVDLSGFFIDRTMITVAEYGNCVTAGACTPPSCTDPSEQAMNTWGKSDKQGHPVFCVARSQAMQYCAWSRLGGRLPSEAEWEKAAKGGCDEYPGKDCAVAMPQFPWGNTLPGPYVVNPTSAAMPALSMYSGASPYGALHMTGNGVQWMLDTYSETAYASAASIDPVHTATTASVAVRGEMWGTTSPANHRSAARSGSPLYSRVGFGARCVSPFACSAAKPSQCDDGNPCTKDTCGGTAGCQHQVVTTACDLDGDACTPDICAKGLCEARPWKCVDGDPCTTDACDAKTGACIHNKIADGGGCDDGEKCTSSDTCTKGKCDGKPKICAKSGQGCLNGECVDPPAPMELVAAGAFFMGCNAKLDSKCQNAEKPQHEVELAAFWIDRLEVTVGAYKTCVDAGKCGPPAYSHSWCNFGVKDKDKHPINCVTATQAEAYCKAMVPGGRLPTEAQWEKAARGGCDKYPGKDCAAAMPTYPWGEEPAGCPYAMVRTNSDLCGTGQYTSAPVGLLSKGASPYGVLDMIGNIWEWTADAYVEDFYSKSPKQEPFAPPADGSAARTVRGGHARIGGTSTYLRAASRLPRSAADQLQSVGFRCARDQP